MTDAMGHEVNAAVLATVLVGALRNARRAELGLAEQARFANNGLGSYVEGGGFVTGQVIRINLPDETATIVNAGHHPPLRLRNGHVEPIVLEPDPPFGLEADYEYRVQQLPLEPGDRLIFLTDGMLERNAEGLDIHAFVVAAADMHPREAVQHLAQAVLEAYGGELRDDATVMCLDWHGGPPRDRTTGSGANH